MQEYRHYEINRDWQALNFVLEGREVADGRYEPNQVTVAPLPDAAALERHLRYAAGVELRIVHLDPSAAFSLIIPATVPANVRDDVEAARAELMCIAVSEMLHLRWVNDVLRARAPVGPFEPALRVASQLPAAAGGSVVATESPADPQTIDRFIDLERPSISVDGLYSRILATLQNGEQRQAIRAIMAEGEDHYRTFRFIREWLGQHQPAAYLRPNLTRPPAANPLHQQLQAQYVALLGRLRQGYSRTRLAGAPDVNASRDAMLGATGIEGAAQQVVNAGFLVVFDPPAAPFAPIDPPARVAVGSSTSRSWSGTRRPDGRAGPGARSTCGHCHGAPAGNGGAGTHRLRPFPDPHAVAELGIVPEMLGTHRPQGARRVAWSAATPERVDGHATVHIERPRLELALLAAVLRTGRIEIVIADRRPQFTGGLFVGDAWGAAADRCIGCGSCDGTAPDPSSKPWASRTWMLSRPPDECHQFALATPSPKATSSGWRLGAGSRWAWSANRRWCDPLQRCSVRGCTPPGMHGYSRTFQVLDV